MVLGLGTDLVAMPRLARLYRRHGPRFLQRCFLPSECAAIAAEPARRDAGIALRWAAKEALLKALGGEVGGIPYRDVEVTIPAGGPPALSLHGRAEAALRGLGGRRALLCLGQDGRYAAATVIIEG